MIFARETKRLGLTWDTRATMMKKVFDQTNFTRAGSALRLSGIGEAGSAKKKKNGNRGVRKLAENIGLPGL